MKTLSLSLQGRAGNQSLQFLFAWHYARVHEFKFECGPWVGEALFDLPKYDRPTPAYLPRYSELDLAKMDDPPSESFEFRGYAQTQFCADYYNKRTVQRLFTIRPEVARVCERRRPENESIVIHRRVGDLIGYGYPAVSWLSYVRACEEYGFDINKAVVLSEENPTPHDDLPDELAFAPDFYRMIKAKTLLRANSTFSFLAAILSHGLVLSPVIEGLAGGKEHDNVPFVAGVWPRFANLDFVQNMHIDL